MLTIAEIEQIKQQGIATLDEQIRDAIGHKNASTSGAERQRIDGQIQELMARRGELHRLAVTTEFASPEMEAALRGLKDAADEMNEAAGRMKATTEFLNNAADFLGAADKVIGVLKH